MSVRTLCLSGLLAAFASTSALPADYGTSHPSNMAGQYLPHRNVDRLPFQLKVLWRREQRPKLHAMPREERRGWLRAEWSRMSEPQKRAKYAELQAKWEALPPNVRQTILDRKRQKRQAHRMDMQGSRGMQGRSAQPAERMQQ